MTNETTACQNWQATRELLDASIDGLAESVRKGATSEASADLAIDEITKEFCKDEPGSPNYTRFRRKVEKTLKDKVHPKLSKEPTDKPVEPGFAFDAAERERSARINQEQSKFDLFREDLAKRGYDADPVKAAAMLLVAGMTKINGAAWYRSGTLSAPIVMYLGSAGTGKTMSADLTCATLDADPDYPHGKVLALASSSPMGPLWAAGEDGMGLKGHVLYFEEMQPEQEVLMDALKKLATSGSWKYISCVANKDTGRKESVAYQLRGPVYVLVTSTALRNRWNHEITSRALILEFESDQELRHKIFRNRIGNVYVSKAELRLIARSWNHFFDNLWDLDPENPDAFLDIDMSVIHDHLAAIGKDTTFGDYDLRRLDVLMFLIAAHCLIHQYHRETRKTDDGRDILIAEKADFNGVVDVFNQCCRVGTSTINDAESAAFRKLIPLVEKGVEVTFREMQLALGKGDSTVWGYLSNWCDSGLMRKERPGVYSIGPAWANARQEALKSGHQKTDDDLVDVIANMVLENRSTGLILSPMD